MPFFTSAQVSQQEPRLCAMYSLHALSFISYLHSFRTPPPFLLVDFPVSQLVRYRVSPCSRPEMCDCADASGHYSPAPPAHDGFLEVLAPSFLPSSFWVDNRCCRFVLTDSTLSRVRLLPPRMSSCAYPSEITRFSRRRP